MPNIDIIAPEKHIPERWNRDYVAEALTEVFTKHAGCAADAVHIRFQLIKPEHYYIGGHSYNDDNQVCEVNVAWYPGRSGDLQELVAAEITAAICKENTDITPAQVEVNFCLLEPQNHYEGGKRAPAP